MKPEKIHVIGGGLVGALTTIYLAQRGFHVVLLERRPDMRRVDISAGRSINLAVTARGLKALGEVGLLEAVMDIAIAMKGRMLHDAEGHTSFVPYGQKESEVIHSVSRGDLNKLLLDKAASYDNVEIFFQQRCLGYDPESSTLTLVDETTSQQKTMQASVIIGTDGGGSVLRKMLAEHQPDFAQSEETLAHGYKELLIPTANGAFQMEKHALHIWPRKSYMLIALPNMDGSFTVTFFFAHTGAESFAALKTQAQVEAFFAATFPDALALMPTLAADFFANPTGSMTTVKCAPWHLGAKAMLMGDAAHAIVPFFGQGMNCGFEDCSTLGSLLDAQTSPDWEALFAQLETARKPNADAIADMALENFVEMRDTVADAKFQLKKQVGFELERRYPGRFIPRYAMVVFHPEISYADARARSITQDGVLDTLCASIDTLEQVDWQKADQLLQQMGS